MPLRPALAALLLVPALAAASVPDITGATFPDLVVTDGVPYRRFLEAQLPDLRNCLSDGDSVVLVAHVSRDGRIFGLGYREPLDAPSMCAIRGAMNWAWPSTAGDKSAVVVTAILRREGGVPSVLSVEARATGAGPLAVGRLFADGPRKSGPTTGGLAAPEKEPEPANPAPMLKVVPGIAKAEGALDAELVTRVLRRHWNLLRYCWESLAPKGETGGRGTLKLRLAADGRVADATLEIEGNAVLKACVASKLAKVRMPAAEGITSFEQVVVFVAEP